MNTSINEYNHIKEFANKNLPDGWRCILIEKNPMPNTIPVYNYPGIRIDVVFFKNYKQAQHSAEMYDLFDGSFESRFLDVVEILKGKIDKNKVITAEEFVEMGAGNAQ